MNIPSAWLDGCPCRQCPSVRCVLGHLRVPLVALGSAAILVVASPDFAFSQSTVIHAEPASFTSADNFDLGRIPNDLPSAQCATERRLSGPPPVNWNQEIRVDDVLSQMRAVGLAVRLHVSARDSALNGDSLLKLEGSGASMNEALQFALEEYHCDLSVTSEGTIIFAAMEWLSYEGLVRVTFDISGLPQDSEWVVETIQEIVDPDSWDESGGSGTVTRLESRQRRLLMVAQSWRNVRNVRRHLESIAAMSGLAAPVTSVAMRQGELSTPVEVPEQYAKLVGVPPGERDRFGRYRNEMFGNGYGRGGRGGAGLGGGVF